MVDAGGLNPPDLKGSCGFESRPGYAKALLSKPHKLPFAQLLLPSCFCPVAFAHEPLLRRIRLLF